MRLWEGNTSLLDVLKKLIFFFSSLNVNKTKLGFGTWALFAELPWK